MKNTEIQDLTPAERLVEAALRQPGAGGLGGVHRPLCPDPETLAAFVEHRLAPDEVGRLEGHLAGCDRCREVLATLVRALPVLQPEPKPGWLWVGWLSSPWRWAVPATALALLLAVWVVSREPVATPSAPETTVAEMLPPSSGIAPEFGDEQAEVARKGQAIPREQGVPSSPEAASAMAPSQPVEGSAPKALFEKAAAPAKTLPQPRADALDRAQPVDTKREKGDRPRAASEAAQAAGVSAQAPAPPQPVTAEAAAVMAARAEPDAARRAEEKAAPTAPLPTKRVQDTGRRALAPRASEIVAADGAARWRFGFAGMLFKSADGMTWERQDTGITLDLLAGSAPSASVCWLVGREGLVLLTTDGERWQRAPFPEKIDLVRIDARDVRSAIVTAADDRRFETTDAGQTWTRVP